VKELSSYAFSPLREGDIALYRGSYTVRRIVEASAKRLSMLRISLEVFHTMAQAFQQRRLFDFRITRQLARPHQHERTTCHLSLVTGRPQGPSRYEGVKFVSLLSSLVHFVTLAISGWGNDGISRAFTHVPYTKESAHGSRTR
jgi:hypothetical protein